jgi:hypothetical protein
MDGHDAADRDWGRRGLSRHAVAVARSVVEALLSDEDPARGLVPPRAELVSRVVDEFDLLLGAGSPDIHRGFWLILFLVEWLPLFVIGAFSRTTRLPLARRVAYFEALEHTRIGLFAALVVGLKIPLSMIAYEVDPELRLSGFDRPTISSRRTLPIVRKAAS